MVKLLRHFVLALLGLAAVAGTANARDLDRELHALQTRWAEITYQTPEQGRSKAYERLAAQAAALSQAFPRRAEPRIWEGIILGSYAGAEGGLAALGLAKQARARLEQALELDAKALAGSAYTSLGSLYYKVPGWPLGFGDDQRAGAYLRQALALNPVGIDPNYFYADYLAEQGDYAGAAEHLRQALAAPDRPGRAVADAGRRAEARALLERVDRHLQ